MIDISKVRRDTRATAKKIHFNNAGASLMPAPVIDAVRAYLDTEEQEGGYEAAAIHEEVLEGFYTSAARLINARAKEIAFAESATIAWGKVFFAFDWQPGDVILTAQAEYSSNFIAYLQTIRRRQVEVRVIPNDASGQIDLQKLADAIDEKTRLIAVTHMPTNGGLVNPAEAIGAIARAHDIPYLLDACQSAGQYPLDVEKIGCDFLSATGRKYLRGPRGTGFLYVREKWLDRLEPEQLDTGSALWEPGGVYTPLPSARRFESWESSMASKAGLKKAFDYAWQLGVETIWERVQMLAAQLRKTLSEQPGIQVCDLGEVQSGIISFYAEGMDAATLKEELYQRGINTSLIGKSGALLDTLHRDLPEMVRASVHYFNTEQEIDAFAKALHAIRAGK